MRAKMLFSATLHSPLIEKSVLPCLPGRSTLHTKHGLWGDAAHGENSSGGIHVPCVEWRGRRRVGGAAGWPPPAVLPVAEGAGVSRRAGAAPASAGVAVRASRVQAGGSGAAGPGALDAPRRGAAGSPGRAPAPPAGRPRAPGCINQSYAHPVGGGRHGSWAGGGGRGADGSRGGAFV